MAEIHLQGVSKVFDKTVAVDNVELHIEDGEFMVLLGPSGCGKTTLLRLLAGLEYPNGGRVRIGDTDVTDLPPRKRDLAMVFQSYAVFPHLKVFDNIAFGLRMRKLDRAAMRQRVERAAALVELGELLDRYPSQLSGGQRQRVAVARAIVMEPAVLLMDEPLSNLDALLRLTFRAQLKELVAELKTTTIYVTHDQVEALSLGDRIAVMRVGRVVQVDTPMAVYDRPATSFVGSFIGNPPMNFLRGRLDDTNGRRIVVGDQLFEVPDALGGTSGEIEVGIRAENIEALTEPAPGALAARADVIEPLGASMLITAVVGDRSGAIGQSPQRVKIQTHIDFPVRVDQPLWLRPEPGKLRWFDVETGREVATA